MEVKNKKERLYAIDVARAICIVLVASYHYYPEDAPLWHDNIQKFLITFRMPFFMFVSGYVYAYIYSNKNVNYLDFVKTKFLRLIIPYFFVSCLIITIKLLTQGSGEVDHPVTMYSYVEMLWRPSAGTFLWFIYVLFIMFMIVPLFKTKQSRLCLFFLTLILALSNVQFPELFSLYKLKSMFVYYMFGIVVCEYFEIRTFFKKIPFVIVFVSFLVISYYNVQGSLFEFGKLANVIVLPLLGIGTMLHFAKFISKYEKVRQYSVVVASATYVIYLLHTTFMGFTKMSLRKIPFLVDPNETIGYLLGTIIVIFVGVVGPVMAYFVIKRYRLTRFLFGLK